MSIVVNASREHVGLAGIDHQTLASHRGGFAALEVWYQTPEPNAETPAHDDEREEVVVALGGFGRAIIAGEACESGPDSMLVIPAETVHQ